LGDNVEKYGRPGQVTDANVILRIGFPCWINKATKTRINKATKTHTHTVL
jgi:hypothetical protein